MGMRGDIEHGDHGQAGACDANPPMWKLGSRITTRNVQAARKAYLRYAETAEYALNRLDSTTSRVGEELWTMATGARDSSPSPDPSGRAAAMKARVARGRADLRDIALRGQIAADTNVRAYMDHLDDLAAAPSARKLVSAQTSYVWDQWQRSLQQAFDLQQRTVGALRKMTSASTA